MICVSPIAIEIKTVVSLSEVRDTENALGQFVLYQNALSIIEPEHHRAGANFVSCNQGSCLHRFV